MNVGSHIDDPFAPPPSSPRRLPGRPRSIGRAYRSAYVTLRVMPSEKIRLLAASRRAGYEDTSPWARGLLLAACDGESLPVINEDVLAEVARLRRDLNSGIGSNLNQAMLHANALAKSGGKLDLSQLESQITAAREAVDALRVDLQKLLRPLGRT